MTRTCLLGGMMALACTGARGDDAVAPPIRLAQATPPPRVESPAGRPQPEPLPPLPTTRPAPAPAPVAATATSSPPAPAPGTLAALTPSPTAPTFTPPATGSLLSGLASQSGGSMPTMIGDQGPSLSIRQATPGTTPPTIPSPFPPPTPPPTPNPRLASALAPSVRGFKIAENQSPRPQDRVYFDFNFFSQVNQAVNLRLESPVDNLQAYRYMLGFEKTFFDRRASFGMRVPINTLTADSTISGNFARPGGTSTSMGDLSLFTKFVFCENPKTGSLISAGLQVTPPTGPGSFAGAKYLQSIHTTTVQPFVGYIWARDRFYFHGFTAMQAPMNPADVTMLYNDFGTGYFLLRRAPNTDPGRIVRLVAPTFEIHINTPMNHRNAFNANDPVATSNSVNFTYGLNIGLGQRSLLTFGFVTPVTNPKPFDYEVIALFNLYFGAPRRVITPQPPIIGG